MKSDFRKRSGRIVAIFCAFLLITISLLSLVSYLSFDQNYREIKQSTYSALCGQIISDMETAISYGKRIDRYFGIEKIFDRTQALFGEEFSVSILSLEGETLYCSENVDETVRRIVQGEEVRLALEGSEVEESYALISRDGYEVLVQAIKDGQARTGYFLLSYQTTVYAAQRGSMLREIGVYTGVALLLGVAVMLGYYFAARGRMEKSGGSLQRALLFGVPTGILIVLIIVVGVVNYVLFQERYEEAMNEGAQAIVEYVNDTMRGLNEKGVSYEEMGGLDEYLADKVESVPVLWNLRVTRVMSDSDSVLGRHNAAFISIPVQEGEELLCVEAFISEEYISQKMWSLFFMFLATFIFCLVIIIELTKLPEMIDARRRAAFDEDSPAAYEQISSGVRIASFLRTLSNYLYLPYSAMLIRQWNQAVGGLSVGMTAALPLTLESAGQVVGIMLYPMWLKRPDKRSRWFFGICLTGMLAINVTCFLTHSALTIIVLRFLGGLCCSGFMHVLNMVIASGNDSEERHQINLAQSNAGIIGGIMCGAGVGAIVAELAGYASSYLISAVMFAVFGWFVLRMLPWKLLERNALANEQTEKQEQGEKLGLMRLAKMVLSPGVLQYFLLVMVPMGMGILYVVTLIPAMVDAQGSAILLSYCYIVNGIAGFYFGPKLVEMLGKRFNNSICIAIAMLMAALGLVALGVPPFALMVLVSSTLLGVFDGFGSPMATDGFLAIPSLKRNVSEVTSLAIYFALCSLVSVVAPMIIELVTQGNITVAVLVLAAAYVGCAALYGVVTGVSRLGRKHSQSA